MTNPDNAIGTNAAYDGRTSVDAFNDDLAAYSRGVLSGWECKVYTGLTVMLGGSSSARDVAIAQDNAGNKTTINNISRDEVLVTVAAAPASNSRIDAIVAYADNPPQGNNTTADNPSACGIIAVSGTPSATPVEPTDNMIRTAITADGASGTTAYYAVLATVTVPTGTTDLIQGYITQGVQATTANISIADDSITANKIDFTTFGTEGEQTFISTAISVGGLWTTIYGTTLKEKGRFVVMASCYGHNATTTGYIGARIVDTNDNNSTVAQNFVGKYVNNRVSINIFGILDNQSGTKNNHIFALQLIAEDGSVQIDGTANIAFLRVK